MNMSQIKKFDKKYIGNTVKRYNASFIKGRGSVLTDKKGKKYVDLLGGVAVNALGYGNKELEKAAISQIKKYLHVSRLFYNEEQIKLAKYIVGNSFGDKVYFINSGAEATEVAVKIARKWGAINKKGAYKIITFKNSFHGRTIAALTATGQKAFHKYLKPLSPGFVHAEFNNIKDVKKKADKRTAAIMIEPVQAEGGVFPADKKFMKELRKFCTAKKILLIADEIQTGVARTGKLFAYSHYGIKPDIMTLGKAIGGGLPLAAVVAGKNVSGVYTYGDHGTTLGGNPVACAAGNVIMKKAVLKSFMKSVESKGKYFTQKLKNAKLDKIRDIRGKGLLIGIEVKGKAIDCVKEAFSRGLLVNAPKPNVLRIVPPLVITKKELDKAIKILVDILK